jgi:hypothetical protein
MVVFRILLGGHITDIVSILILVSLALTFSTWGIFAFLTAMIGIAISVFSKKRRKSKAPIPITIALTVGMLFFYATNMVDPALEYILGRLDYTQGSANFRVIAFEDLVNTFDAYIPLGLPMQQKFCPTCQSPQDLGLWSQMIVRFGALAAVIVLAVSLISAWRHSPTMLLLVAFAFTGKYDLNHPIVWMFFSLVLLPYYSVRSRSVGSIVSTQ